MTAPLKTWLIEPRDPLIVRDGRPFGNTPGARARSYAFPFPATIAGAVRTRHGRAAGIAFHAKVEDEAECQKLVTDLAGLRAREVRGPLLVELDQGGNIKQWLLPAPADAQLYRVQSGGMEQGDLRQLVPLSCSGLKTDLTTANSELALIGLRQTAPGKPHPRPPRFWHEQRFFQWLEQPQEESFALVDLGYQGATPEHRTHVRIQANSQTAEEGMLYQTRGLEFTGLETRTRLALAVATTADQLQPGFAPLGGERRLAHWRPSQKPLPACPPALRQQIMKQRHCRLILLTPAMFVEGYWPHWIQQEIAGITAQVKAVACQRAQVVSGWDFDRTKVRNSEEERKWQGGRPKPTRRLTPAGSVYFLELTGESESIGDWIDAVWMHCVSDDAQDRLDGFGLAALGTWDGQYQLLNSQEVQS